MKKKKSIKFLPIIFLIIISVIILIDYRSINVKKVQIPYKNFITQVTKGKISDVYLTENELLKVKTKSDKIYYIQNPRSLNFKETLLIKGVSVHEGDGFNPLQSIPISLIIVSIGVLVFYFIIRESKSKNKAFKLSSIDVEPEKNTGIDFKNIAGNEEAAESVKELVDFIKFPEKYAKYNARMPRGIILYGPPGTGKTLMAKALSKEADVPFFAVNGSDFVQIYVGVGAGRIRDLFKKAREKGKAVIFIDEIDAIGKKRNGMSDGGSDERDQTLNALLAEMSGFKESEGIIVMAATNRLDVLDEALLRPGRFDRHIEVGLPDVNARYKILQLHCKNKPIAESVDLYKIAQMTVYFSGAKLENLVNEAALLAVKENTNVITMEQLDKAYGIVVAGADKKERSHIKENDKLITAYHEAGHALISKLTCPENIVRKVTIIPSTKGAGGYTVNIPPDRMYQTKNTLLNNIKVSLGGRAAEEIIFGEENITTGAFGDIDSATKTLLAMVKDYGMFNNIGLLNYNTLKNESIDISNNILDFCKDTISGIYSEVKDLLLINKDLLEKVVAALIEKEVIYDNEFDELLSYNNKEIEQ